MSLRSFGDKTRKRIRKELRARDGDDCHLCGGLMVFQNNKNPDFATIDHVVPRSKGGKGELSNLKLAHNRCNNLRGDSDLCGEAEHGLAAQ